MVDDANTLLGKFDETKGMCIKYFSLYSVNVQCEGFAKLTFVFFFSFDETKENVHEVVLDPLKLLNEKCPRVAVR
jgi:hypothetical protein